MRRFTVLLTTGICFLNAQLIESMNRFFIPTQEHFFAQQSSQAVFHRHPVPESGETAVSSASASSEGFSQGFHHRPVTYPHAILGPTFGFGGGWYPFFSELGTAPIDFNLPTVLKPSISGWDTTYNVPCGSYQIFPFVVAHLRLSTSPPPAFIYPAEQTYKRSLDEQRLQDPRYIPYFPSKSCSWNFSTGGQCRLKFKCDAFQLPALFRCEENILEISDSENEKHTFCGSRQPRRNRVYNSTTGKMKLTFRSQNPSLPAVFDCTVSCGLEYLNHLPQDITDIPFLSIESTKPPGSTTTTDHGVVIISANSNTTDLTSKTKNDTTTKPTQLRFGECKCGEQNKQHSSRGRIVGGGRTLPGEYPWTAALVRKSSVRPFCAASIINNRYVVTAAHCVLSHKIRQPRTPLGTPVKDLFDVVLNEHDIREASEFAGGPIRVHVNKIIVHPKYDNATYDYDIALLRLETPIDFDASERSTIPLQDDYYNRYTFQESRERAILNDIEARYRPSQPVPICLSTRNGKSLVDKTAVVTGWGLTREGGLPSEEMLQATVKIFNETSCQEFYSKHQYVVTENMICAGYLDGRRDSCVGDSGGSLSILEKDRYTLAGIVSWGRGCGRKNLPGVYTRVAGLTEWIQSEGEDAIWCK